MMQINLDVFLLLLAFDWEKGKIWEKANVKCYWNYLGELINIEH